MRPLLTLLLLVFNLCLLQAQPDLTFQYITPADGLSGAYNHFVKQDRYGDLWISSMEGVFRYDGLEMCHYTEDSEDVPGMLGKNVQSDFFEDTAGNIWFSTYKAVNRYIRAENRFEAIQICTDEGQLLDAGYHLFWLEQDSVLWMRAGNDLYTYHIPSQKTTRLLELDYYTFAVQADTAGNVRKIIAGQVMGTAPLVILHMCNRQVRDQQFFQVRVNDQPLAFQSAYIQSDTLVWLCTDLGLLALNPKNLQNWQHYALPNSGGQRLRRVVQVDKQHFLVATETQGIWLFDFVNRIFMHNQLKNETKQGNISDNNIRNLYLSPDGQIWLSYNQGKTLDHTWLQSNHFHNPLTKVNISSPDVVSLSKDGKGHIWCATRGNGIFVLEKNGNLIYHFLPEELAGESNRIIQLSSDANGNIWVTAMRKVLVFSTKSEKWSHITLPDDTQVYFLLHLSPQRKLISTNQGIRELAFDGNNYQVTRSSFFPAATNLDYFQMFQGNDDRFYVPANGNTLIYFSFDNVKQAHKLNGSTNGVWEDEAHFAWIGASNGLFQLNLATNYLSKVELTIANEKPSQIYSVQGDRHGRLWLSTDKGIWRYDPKSERSHAFYHYRNESHFADGMLYASLQDRDGKIWFGTSEGLIVFHPDSIQPFPGMPHVKIKSLLVNNEPYRALPNVDDLQTLQLPYRKNNLTLTTIAVNQYYPKSNKIGYQFKNMDEQWQWVPNGTAITLPSLPPGRYELEIKAVNLHGLEGESRTVHIHILTPIWLRWWFILLSIAAVTGIGYLIVRAYVRRKLRQQRLAMERQQALQEERNRIADELHDDLGWGLTRIQYISANLLHLKKVINSRSKIENIYDYTRILLDDMSDIIWILNTETETLANWLTQLQSDIYEFLEAANLKHRIHFSGKMPNVELDRSWRRNTLLAMKEVLRNITKHAAANCVEIKVRIQNDRLHLRIHDDGKGFNLNELNKDRNGRGVQNILKRIKALNGTVTWEKRKGTLVSIDIPLPK